MITLAGGERTVLNYDFPVHLVNFRNFQKFDTGEFSKFPKFNPDEFSNFPKI